MRGSFGVVLLLAGLVLSLAASRTDGPSAAALTAGADERCPHGRFYAYRDNRPGVEAEENDLFHYCRHETFHCTTDFITRMLNHPCRTETLDESTRAVAVLHALSRHTHAPLPRDDPNHTFVEGNVYNSSQRAFAWAREMFQRMPHEVATHPHLYLFSAGEAYLAGDYELLPEYPQHATVFVAEPLWAQYTSRTGYYPEPRMPRMEDACYLYAPSPRYASVPFWQNGSETNEELALVRQRSDAERPHRVFHFASMHGQAAALRWRLYGLCEGQGGWYCPHEGARTAQGALQGQLPLAHDDFMRVFGSTTFALMPTGDSPGRISMWDCLRRGCVPVLFSSCPHAHMLDSHAGWLPPDTSEGFGVRTWAVLLNQTAVMSSDTYLRDALASVTDEQLSAMRAAVRPYLAKMSYEPATDDALELTVQHILMQRRGAPEHGPPLPPKFRSFVIGGALQSGEEELAALKGSLARYAGSWATHAETGSESNVIVNEVHNQNHKQ